MMGNFEYCLLSDFFLQKLFKKLFQEYPQSQTVSIKIRPHIYGPDAGDESKLFAKVISRRH